MNNAPIKDQKSLLPALELPKGGGAINSIGEKFSVNTLTGTGTASIPVPLSPGRNNFSPALQLQYDSGNGNSPFGLGWNLTVPSISRKTARGLPQYQDTEDADTFVLSGAEDLVPFLDDSSHWEPKTDQNGPYIVHHYRPRTEGSFSKIEKWVHRENPAEVFWKTTSPENISSYYGKTEASRVSDPDHPSRVFQWLLCESRDNRGNTIHYQYQQEDQENIDSAQSSEYHRTEKGKAFNQKYLKRVCYGNRQPNEADNWHFQLVLDYGDHHPEDPALEADRSWSCRQDPFSSYRSGFEIRTYRLCKRLLLFHQFDELNNGNPTLVRSTTLTYDENPIATTLTEAWQTGYIREGENQSEKSTPPVRFGYTAPIVGQQVQSLPKESLAQLPQGLGGPYQFVDLEGDALSGILTKQGGGWYYKTNEGEGLFSNARSLPLQPSLGNRSLPQIQDLDGDGRKELVVLEEQVSGFYNYRDLQWEPFTPFETMPNINWQDPNLKLIDLNGDGYADILITEDNLLRWFPSKAKKGYKNSRTVQKALEEQDGPALVFADANQSIYLADMSGDGLTDIVRVRNQDIAYWPNLGYGRFGAKVSMGHAPCLDHPDQFNQQNIRLADIDGTGTTDLLYFGSEGACFWINQAGNSWSEPHTLDQFPATNQLTNVQLADLLGNGTPCLVWSSLLPADAGNPIKYIDLMEASAEKPLGKPYLLNTIDNGMGKADLLHYAPSTKHYLADKKAGTPWVTKLHFPVYVVEKVETIDQISGSRLSVTYQYHHGYFDPYEREFRGFGRVDQIDTESFEEFERNNPDEEQQTHFSPPILTKTWFHTGAYVEEKRIDEHFRQEYFTDEAPLSDNRMELYDETDFDTRREAHRAMRGQMLRQEVYALDAQENKSTNPYTVTSNVFTVRQIQPRQKDQAGVYLPIPNESIAFHYERNPEDPRVSHSITLETDRYGSPVWTAQVVYPRKINNRDHIEAEQLLLHIVMSESEMLHMDEAADHYLLGIPLSSKSFECTGITPLKNYFTREELRQKLAEVHEIPFHSEADGSPQKRLLSWNRNYYWQTDLSAALPLGEAAWPLLPHHAEAAVFTPELLQSVYGERMEDETITSRGGYHLRDGYWWNPGVVAHYQYHDIVGEGDLRERENPFLLVVETQEPFEVDPNLRDRVFYDRYQLFPIEAENKEGLSSQAVIDYRTLSIQRLTDVNENVSEALTDAMGMVVAATTYGTEEDEDGNVFTNGDLPIADYRPTVLSGIPEVVDNPHRFLQGASTFFYYDLHAWKDRKEPTQSISLTRETHARELPEGSETEIQIALSYSDGFGRELQKKIKVEAGLAYLSDEAGSLVTDAEGKVVQEEVEDRWLSSGRTIYNNKQKPIKQYEPFYSNTHRYLSEESAMRIGISPLIHYDPLMRVIKTVTPAGFVSRVEFTPWEQRSYDLNDALFDSSLHESVSNNLPLSEVERMSYDQALPHANTPQISILDSLGRAFKTMATDGRGETFTTTTGLNISGQPLTQTDPRQYDLNNTPERANQAIHNFTYVYDMSGTPLYTRSIDAGENRVFINVSGQPVYTWTARGYKNTVVYDALNRPTEHWVEGEGLNGPQLIERSVYAAPDSLPSQNLRGHLLTHYDQSGKKTILRVGFKGEVTASAQQFISIFDPAQADALRDDLGEMWNWDLHNDDALEEEVFQNSAKSNALGQLIHTVEADGSVHRPRFNHSGQLKGMAVKLNGAADFEDFVKNIRYNEKGQRASILYGNDVTTTYTYEPETYRLKTLQSHRNQAPKPLQDLSFIYDPVGNIIRISDAAQQTIYFNNQVVEAVNAYTYDAFYQLRSATGREHIGQNGQTSAMDQVNGIKVLPHKGDGGAMRSYTRTYDYDKAGNMLTSVHQLIGEAGYTRHFEYDTTSNRLLRSGIGQEVNWQNFRYDAAGNIQDMAHLDAMHWSPNNELQQIHNADLSAFYEYDSSGERSRKIVKKGNRKVEVRYYLGATEVYREYNNGTLIQERESLHISDDTQRIAMVDTLTVKGGEAIALDMQPSLRRYQLSNHLGSSAIELDEAARVISYEEYYPYGSSSYQAVDKDRGVPRKRYRYTGMERDEESSLNYHSARYYAPWLCRWLKPDPAGTVDGLNVYRYVNGNPVRKVDFNGTKGEYFFDANIPDYDDKMVFNKKTKKEVRRGRLGFKTIDRFLENRPERIKTIHEIAKRVNIDPGLLTVITVSETRSFNIFFNKGQVLSFSNAGLDDFLSTDKSGKPRSGMRVRYEMKKAIPEWKQISRGICRECTFSDFRGNKYKGYRMVPNEKKRLVPDFYFQTGSIALLAIAAEIKVREINLRKINPEAFDQLPIETQFFLVRLSFNAGHKTANAEFEKYLTTGDSPLILNGFYKKIGPRRIATIRASQAIRISQKFFPDFYDNPDHFHSLRAKAILESKPEVLKMIRETVKTLTSKELPY